MPKSLAVKKDQQQIPKILIVFKYINHPKNINNKINKEKYHEPYITIIATIANLGKKKNNGGNPANEIIAVVKVIYGTVY